MDEIIKWLMVAVFIWFINPPPILLAAIIVAMALSAVAEAVKHRRDE